MFSQQAGLRTAGTLPRVPVRYERSITPLAVVASDLAADTRGSSAKTPRDVPHRLASCYAARNLLSLGQSQAASSSPLGRRRKPTSLLDNLMDGLLGLTQRSPDLTEWLALLPPRPNLFLFTRC
jgi:hypothetical protein